jgi:5'-AMP-activated protein kinase regulatory beta subunit
LKQEDHRPGGTPDAFHGEAGWPATPKLVPVVIVCKWREATSTCLKMFDLVHTLKMSAGSHAGSHVEVEGSFDNWTTRQVLQRSGKESTIVKLLPPGVYQVSLPSFFA